MPLRLTLLFLTLLALQPLAAQVEVNPYLGYPVGADLLRIGEGGDARTYDGDRYLAGVDALFGARQLAPMAGLLYLHQQYTGEAAAASFSYGRVHLPLGFAYRVLPPDFDLNLVPALAVAPGYVVGGDAAPEFAHDIDWSVRAGLRIYLDYVTLGVHYFNSLTDHYPTGREEPPPWLLTLGLRL